MGIRTLSNNKRGTFFKELFKRQEIILFLFLVFLCIVFSIISYPLRGEQVFFTSKNFLNILLQSTITGIAAIGCTAIILSGAFDLSIGSLQSVVGLAAVYFANITGNVIVGVLAGVFVGAIVGSVNSLVVLKMKVNSFIATLAMMGILRGLVYIITGGRSIALRVSWLNWLGTGYIGEIPVPVIILIVLYGIFYVVLNKSPFGRYIYAVGGNTRATLLAGINTQKIKFGAFLLSGILASLSGIILAARLNSAQPRSAYGFELLVISAVILGGTSLSGGRGNLMGTIIGVLTLGVISNALVIYDVNPFYIQVVRGVILIMAVFIDQLRRGKVTAGMESY